MSEIITLAGEVQGALALPRMASGVGVLILTGSSGRVDLDRARLFADRGAVALAQRWWGGEGQAPGINLIPLEVFLKGVDRLRAEGCNRIAVLGTSRGAEAALLTAVRDPRIEIAIAISPSHVVWQDFGPGLDGVYWPPRSAFTWEGRTLPCIIYDPRVWPAVGAPQIYRPTFEKSLQTFAEDVPAASIPVEEARAEIILVAGAGDLLWPSDTSAHYIAERLKRHGKAVTVIEHPHAGHSPVFPGEPRPPEPAARAWGGTQEADRELGAAAWAEITSQLGLPA